MVWTVHAVDLPRCVLIKNILVHSTLGAGPDNGPTAPEVPSDREPRCAELDWLLQHRPRVTRLSPAVAFALGVIGGTVSYNLSRRGPMRCLDDIIFLQLSPLNLTYLLVSLDLCSPVDCSSKYLFDFSYYTNRNSCVVQDTCAR